MEGKKKRKTCSICEKNIRLYVLGTCFSTFDQLLYLLVDDKLSSTTRHTKKKPTSIPTLLFFYHNFQ